MDRREFLTTAFLSTIYSSGVYSALKRFDKFMEKPKNKILMPTITDRILVNITLAGGPDYRHLFPPPYDSNASSYGYAYWSNRYTSNNIANDPSAWSSRWSSAYTQTSSGSTNFGILSTCNWLIDQWNSGNVAVICNVVGGTNRDHSHSLLMLELGDPSLGPNDFGSPGWGGRLVNATTGNTISATNRVRNFCNGVDSTNPNTYNNSSVISLENSRSYGLYHYSGLATTPDSTDSRAIMTRALKSYYEAKRSSISSTSVFKKFVDQETSIRTFGDQINARLATLAVPSVIENLYTGSNTLNSTYLGRQTRNLFDAFFCQDLLSMRVASLELGGWDTHQGQLTRIENNLNDLFGTNGALDALTQSLTANVPTALDNVIYVLSGEFGRQVSSNGDAGTDHGSGNIVLVIGNNVNGGVYGEMFPSTELAANTGYNRRNAGITGLTSIERVFGACANWMQSGIATTVFPNHDTSLIETTGLLDNLFSS